MTRSIFLISVSALALQAVSASADSNVVYLDQSGTSQDATITQSHSGFNQVGTAANPFSQSDGSGSGHNSLTVTQSGDHNRFAVNLPGFQSGKANSAEVSQAGKNSSVDLQQTGTKNGVAFLPWTNGPITDGIRQDGTANGSAVTLQQNGKNNVFDIAQGGAGNRTNVSQSGNNGMVYVRQDTSLPDTTLRNPKPYKSNAGNNSTIDVNQTTTSGWTYAAVAQGGGDGNHVTIGQNGSLLNAGVNQSGSGNVFYSSQTDNGNAAGQRTLLGPDTPIKQIGDNNSYSNFQSGTGNSANGTQTGSFNVALNIQSGSVNELTGTQKGIGNSVTSTQSGAREYLRYSQTSTSYGNTIVSSQSGGGDDAYLSQNGNGNSINGSQSGGLLNTVTAEQAGNGNTAQYAQVGSLNGLTLTQTGNGNHSATNQTGVHNVIKVTQH
ncbi:curlin [Rhodopseudomonas sp. G2_2311]|uniref:curlin n=1 Tax=Rhodopseudomonas sp. G2_2311 TaxID=3114287 RepID=UPI0039C688C8